MDKKSECAAGSGESKETTSLSDSNLESGKEKLPEPLDQIGDSEEDLLLCSNSEDSSDGKGSAKKCPNPGNSEKYFSDIESSDNSQEYELKAVKKGVPVIDLEKEKEETSADVVQIEEKLEKSEKISELELEPVESDEDEFDENLSARKTKDEEAKESESVVKETCHELADLEDVSQEAKEESPASEETVETNIEAEENAKEESSRPENEDVLEEKEEPSIKCSIIDENNKKLEVKEDDTSNQAISTSELKEKRSEDCSIQLETEKEDDTQQKKDLELKEGQKDDGNEKVQQKNVNENESVDPIREEIAKESGNETQSKTQLGDSETEKETTEEQKKPNDADSSEEKTDQEAEGNISTSTEEVSKGPKADGPQDHSSQPSVQLDRKSSESSATESEAVPPAVEPISKETAEISVKLEEPEPKDHDIGMEDSSNVTEKGKGDNNVEVMSDKEIVVAVEDNLNANKEEQVVETTKVQEQPGNSIKSDLGQLEKAEERTENTEELTELAKEDTEKSNDKAETLLVEEATVTGPEKEKENEKLPEATDEASTTDILESRPLAEEAKQATDGVEIEEQADTASVIQQTDEPKATDDEENPPSPGADTPTPALFDDDSHLRDKLTTKVSEMMKTIDTSSLQGLTSDDDESLLVIDTTHKDDNENEDNEMDTETEQTAATASATDSSSDGSLEIFYHKECSNYDCGHGSKNFYRAPQFTLNYYKVSKKRYKPQFVCEDCYDQALHAYEEMCVILKQKQPLYVSNFKRQDIVEIIDSSDEEDTESNVDTCKDENILPKQSIELLENELEGIIRNVMQSVDIQNQLSWTKQVLQRSLDRVKEESNYVSDQLQQLQKKADKMHNSLYQSPSIKIRQLTPLDLNSGRSYSPESESTIPAIGEIERPSIQLNETYYAVKNKAIASWVPCKVVEEVEDITSPNKNLKHFKIKFLKSKYPMLKTLSAKHMAYFDPPKVRLPIGTRVIAYFDASSLSRGKEKMLIPSAFYPGIIAEPLKMSNKFRYLVFYDDGYFQYVSYKDVRLVCHASEHVWDDVHHQSRDFIQNYLTQYAVNRPMVQTQKGQCMLVDYNGKWVYARVVDVDCSLVQMMFEGQSRSEWIYRGSTRLGPVYKESNNIAPKTSWNQSRISRRTEPFIRYLNDEDPAQSQSQSQQHQPKPGEVRSVAKKSVSRSDSTTASTQPVPVVKHLNNSTIFVDDDNKPKGKVVYYTARKNLPPRDYVPHICSPSCPFVITHNLQYYSPLAKPLLSGWERQVFRQKSKKFIVYRGPCGKRLRSMEELHRYLRVTSNDLNVDNFDFSPETNCLAEYVIESCIVQKKDISNGEERMPIPCVNYYDNTMPPDCKYSSRRIPTEGVHLNVDPDFLVGCDCDDDCSDKSKCSCWQLTYAGAKYSMPNVPHDMVGYQYKRLYAHVPTGIYECNSRCKCKANCVNRVVQQSLQSKLQVFKTSNRGWGLRCINDVPRGSFICIYAGHLLTEQKANEGGLDAGDEYFAELDYIEVAEQIKEGYESDVIEQDEEEEMYNPDKDDDDDEFIAPDPYRHKSLGTRLSTRRSTKNSSDAEHDSQERQVISFEPNKSQERPESPTERPTMRRLFGKDEGTYIMDAKITGNLGRYFNHSCSPNLFVQNVFVDTHDLRFPWVAFFAFSHIRAGTELTWNYNYEVGVVPGKVLYCQCGAPNCRQRLL